jgi:integrase
MARERQGFIVSEVCAVVQYIDADGHQQKISEVATVKAANPHKLTDAQKHEIKIRRAKQFINDTIADLKKKRATKCKGSIEVRYSARVGHTDEHGKRHDVVRAAESRTHARELIRDILRELEERGPHALDASRMTFADLASYFEKHYLKPAEYVDNRKVEGMRSIGPARAAVNALKAYFGKRRLQSIRYSDIRAYRAARLKEPTRGDVARHSREVKRNAKAQVKVTRTIATVNRELSKLRRMFNIAQREGWIRTNPFATGESLISLADERKRERILTREEERRLLEACGDPRRAHLRPIVVAAIDTGMRRGEILALRWRDVDFEHGLITIQAFNTKTMKERQVSITARLSLELAALYEESPKDPTRRVFGITDNVKRSFTAARKVAGLLDVRFHDLRHTHATRLVSAHIPLSEVGRVLGHTQANTTYRYVNANVETARRASAALDAFNAEGEGMPALNPASDVVN